MRLEIAQEAGQLEKLPALDGDSDLGTRLMPSVAKPLFARVIPLKGFSVIPPIYGAGHKSLIQAPVAAQGRSPYLLYMAGGKARNGEANSQAFTKLIKFTNFIKFTSAPTRKVRAGALADRTAGSFPTAADQQSLFVRELPQC